MCGKACKKKVKSYDSFGAPIGVTFKGESDYKTVFGGVVTIFLVLLLGGNLAMNSFNFLTQRSFTQQISSEYYPENQEQGKWTMNTKF